VDFSFSKYFPYKNGVVSAYSQTHLSANKQTHLSPNPTSGFGESRVARQIKTDTFTHASMAPVSGFLFDSAYSRKKTASLGRGCCPKKGEV